MTACKQIFVLQPFPHPSRKRAAAACMEMPDGYVCTIKPKTRSLDQNAIFHAICDDVAKQADWMGKRLDASQWKVLFVSGHAMATKEGAEVVPGLEGEFVNIRESTARMNKARATSLIEYTLAWCATNGIRLSEDA